MAKIRMVPVKAGKHTILAASDPSEPIREHEGAATFLCGDCSAVLLKNVQPHHYHDVAFKCSCGALNELPAPSVLKRLFAWALLCALSYDLSPVDLALVSA